VNVAEAPAHWGLLPEVREIVTDGVSKGFTDIVIPLLVAVVGLAQVALEVMTHVTTCPSVSEVVVKVELLLPTLEPLTFHW
jgi:hypothetical protein